MWNKLKQQFLPHDNEIIDWEKLKAVRFIPT